MSANPKYGRPATGFIVVKDFDACFVKASEHSVAMRPRYGDDARTWTAECLDMDAHGRVAVLYFDDEREREKCLKWLEDCKVVFRNTIDLTGHGSLNACLSWIRALRGQTSPVPQSNDECPECWGTGLKHGLHLPCSRGCAQ